MRRTSSKPQPKAQRRRAPGAAQPRCVMKCVDDAGPALPLALAALAHHPRQPVPVAQPARLWMDWQPGLVLLVVGRQWLIPSSLVVEPMFASVISGY